MGIDKLKQARDHLRAFHERSRSLVAAAPEAQKLEEQLEWEVRTLEDRPAEAANLSTAGIDDRSDQLFERVTTCFPSLPTIDLVGLTFVDSIASSTASETVSYVMDVGRIGTKAATEYASRALGEYRVIQERQSRPAEVRRLLEGKFPSLIERFDAARSAYDRCRTGQSDTTDFGIAARNLIDGLKGELMERARRTPRESVSIELAVSRVFGDSPTLTDVEYEMKRRGDLIAALSEVAKARRQAGGAELDGMWSRVLDHAVVVLSGLS